MKVKNIAIILAGGVGKRFGNSVPKQFVKLAGEKVIEYTIRIFENHDMIDEIVVVSHKDYLTEVQELCAKNKFSKVVKIIPGGVERYESSFNAIKLYSSFPEYNILFHDAVRPFVDKKTISDVIDKLNNDFQAVDTAVPATDTIIKVLNDKIVEIPNRDNLRFGHTPQGFKVKTILEAYEIALKDSNFKVTDDCGVVKTYLPNIPIVVVDSTYDNIKITNEIDLDIANKIFQIKTQSFKDRDNSLRMESFFNKKTVMIFGGTAGIGKSIADKLSQVAENVFVFGKSTGMDISSEEDVLKSFENTYKQAGKIDIVINTAGILKIGNLSDMSTDDVKKIIDVNLLGSFLVSKYAYKYLKETSGHLILFGSSSYSRGRENYSVYSATKAAVVNMTQALSEEWFVDKIKVNCVNPQRTKTKMRLDNFGEEPEDALLTPERVADDTINLLMSNVTGQIVSVKL